MRLTSSEILDILDRVIRLDIIDYVSSCTNSELKQVALVKLRRDIIEMIELLKVIEFNVEEF